MTIYVPYTYLIGWTSHNKWYYGVQYAKRKNNQTRCPPAHPSNLWTFYFTSSSNVKNFRDLYGEPDVIQIRRTFKSELEARNWEFKVLRRMKVKDDDRFLNQHDGRSPDNRGIVRSAETRAKLSAIGKARPPRKMSEEAKAKMRKPKSKPRTDEHRVALSAATKSNWNDPVFRAVQLAKRALKPKIERRPLPPREYETRWVAVLPNGEEQTVSNLRQFCREHNLSNVSMTNILSGSKASPYHKGYTIRPI